MRLLVNRAQRLRIMVWGLPFDGKWQNEVKALLCKSWVSTRREGSSIDASDGITKVRSLKRSKRKRLKVEGLLLSG